jgi:hypothetical protein
MCPTAPYIVQPKNAISLFTSCGKPTQVPQDILSILVPESNISSEYFIRIYYNINNLNELLTWLENNTELPYRTKERVFDNGMIEYGKYINIIDQRFINHIMYIFNYNMHIIYNSIRPYIKLNKENITLINPIYVNNNKYTHKDDKKTIQLIRYYIKDKFINPEFIYKYISKFIKYYKKKLSDINLSNTLVHNIIEYIIKCINSSFD